MRHLTEEDPKGTGQIVGYRRVSSAGQNLARQEHEAMATCDQVFEDAMSAADLSGQRSQRSALIAYVRAGDTVRVHALDRLARSLPDLIGIIEALNGKGVTVEFLTEGLIFRPGSTDPFSTLQLHILGAVAEFERSLIRNRQAEGIAAAKVAGKYHGRKPTIDRVRIKRLASLGEKPSAIAQLTGVSRASVYRILKGEGGAEIHRGRPLPP